MADYIARPVKVSAHIPAPPDEVFAFVADTMNDPLWCPNVETVERIDGEGVEVGSRYRFHQHLDRPGGARIQFDGEVEIVALANRRISWAVRDRFQDREVILEVGPHKGGSRVTQVTRASFHRQPGFTRWVYPLLARRTFKDQFRNLAAHFEASAAGR